LFFEFLGFGQSSLANSVDGDWVLGEQGSVLHLSFATVFTSCDFSFTQEILRQTTIKFPISAAAGDDMSPWILARNSI